VPAQISVTRTPGLPDARIVDGYALVFDRADHNAPRRAPADTVR